MGGWAEMGDDSKVRIFPIFLPEQGKHMVLHCYFVMKSKSYLFFIWCVFSRKI